VTNQTVPIPSYLIAIACGNIHYREFPKCTGRNWTTGIWAEPEILDAAYWEFSEDTGRYEYYYQNTANLQVPSFLAAAEDVVGAYQFGVYHLLVLPPSFPYGGMVRLNRIRLRACLTVCRKMLA
jgi:leukotriene-A4 hydrolase